MRTQRPIRARLLFLAGLLIMTSAQAGNWPAWRGPLGTGVSTEKELPLNWSTNENVRWRTPLPERGNSTTIIWDNRVFVTQGTDRDGGRTLICFYRADGQHLWHAVVCCTCT